MTTTGDTMAQGVALRLRALAATRWIDRSDAMFRYLEVEVPGAERRVLLPINFTRVSNRQVSVV